jgi:hypothetical protein
MKKRGILAATGRGRETQWEHKLIHHCFMAGSPAVLGDKRGGVASEQARHTATWGVMGEDDPNPSD